jgi:hypothetical protein
MASGAFYKKVLIHRLLVASLLMLLLILNWVWVGRIQNVHAIGLATMAIYLFPPKIESRKYLVIIGLTLLLALAINSLADYDPLIRTAVLFGPNTDASLIILLISPILYSRTRLRLPIYLTLSVLAVFFTQSRSAFILTIPILLLALPRSNHAASEKLGLAFSYSTYIFMLIFSYYIYENIYSMYENTALDPESRWNFASQAADLDRWTSFWVAKERSFSAWPSILFGSDILPAVTGATNVVHSELFSSLFGGGIFLFFIISTLLVNNFFRVRSRFSFSYIFCYLFAAGFSTSMLTFPFLYAIYLLFGSENCLEKSGHMRANK